MFPNASLELKEKSVNVVIAAFTDFLLEHCLNELLLKSMKLY